MSRPLRAIYPWTQTPLIASAPMLKIAQPALAVAVSAAGGIGFVAGGFDLSALDRALEEAAERVRALGLGLGPGGPGPGHHHSTLPIGVGFTLWGSELTGASALIRKHQPAAVWLFAARETAEYGSWARRVREVTGGRTRVWVQVGGVAEGMDVMRTAGADVLVAQGADAGGHGCRRSAGVVALVPEMRDALDAGGFAGTGVLAAGGVVDGRGVAAAVALGADGVVMGTAFLGAEEARVDDVYREEILRAEDGGVATVRARVFDEVKRTNGWPSRYDGRALLNRTFLDAERGMPLEENMRLHQEAEKRDEGAAGREGRVIRYAGAGVGLIKQIRPAGDIVREARQQARARLQQAASVYTEEPDTDADVKAEGKL